MSSYSIDEATVKILTDVGPDVEEDRLRVLVHGLHHRGDYLLLPDPGPQDPPGHVLVHLGVLHADRGLDACTQLSLVFTLLFIIDTFIN